MVNIDTVYKSDLISVFLITSTYDVNYREKDYNPMPAISFPIKSGYKYSSGNFDSIVDTNTILFEAKDIEFALTKFSEFQRDITLSFQFRESSFELFDNSIRKRVNAETFSRSPQIEYLIQLFLKMYPRGNTLLIDQIIDDLLFRELVDQPSSAFRIKSIKPWINIKIDTAKEYIHSCCSEDISIADISASCNISPFHFSRVFKSKTCCSPYEYLMKVRIAKAKQLLKNNFSVTSSAFDVGFNSIENFSYGFKKIVGMSPIQYKKSNISKDS